MTTNEVWNAAQFITEWDADGYRYKLLRVPRKAIDEDSNEPDAHLLLGIDSGNVRRVDLLLDTAYSRSIGAEAQASIVQALEEAPEEAAKILRGYCGDASTIRERAIEHVSDFVSDAALHQHELNIWTLYVMPDGRLYWGEEPSTNSWDVLKGTNAPVASIYQCGTGSCKCNCDACSAGEDPSEWAGSSDDVGFLRDTLEANIERIGAGYFEDEEDEEDSDEDLLCAQCGKQFSDASPKALAAAHNIDIAFLPPAICYACRDKQHEASRVEGIRLSEAANRRCNMGGCHSDRLPGEVFCAKHLVRNDPDQESTVMTTITYELTYDLPGPSGGHRSDPRSYEYPAIDTDENDCISAAAVEALATAQADLDKYIAQLVERGARNIRISKDAELTVNL